MDHRSCIQSAVAIDAAPQHLDPASLRLFVDASAPDRFAGPCRFARLARLARLFQEVMQALKGIGAIQALRPEALSLDDQDAATVDTATLRFQQACLDGGRQRATAYVETQLHGTRYLVDVLPAGPLGAYRLPLYVAHQLVPLLARQWRHRGFHWGLPVGRNQAYQGAVAGIRQQVEHAIRALSNIADAAQFAGQYAFLSNDAFAFDLQPYERAEFQ